MAKEKRRSWLDKIGKWILDVLPAEESSPDVSSKKITEINHTEKSIPEATPLGSLNSVKNTSAKKTRFLTQDSVGSINDTVKENDIKKSTEKLDVDLKTINKAWQAFQLAWSKEGLSSDFFLQAEHLEKTLSILDRSFQEELIEWLFQLCNKPQALKDLAGIIERGQVRPTDNIDAIRAFAYVSVAVARNEEQFNANQESSAENEFISEDKSDQIFVSDNPKPLEDQLEELSQDDSLESDLNKNSIEVSDKNVDSIDSISRTSAESISEIRNLSLVELGLSVRCVNSLRRADINSLFDLGGKTYESLLSIKNLGAKSVEEIIIAIENHGLPFPFECENLSPSDSGLDGDLQSQSNPDDIRNLGLSVGSLNALQRANFLTISALTSATEEELLSISNFGPIKLLEIKNALDSLGLSLLPGRVDWSTESSDALGAASNIAGLQEDWLSFKEEIQASCQGLEELNPDFLLDICEKCSESLAKKEFHQILINVQALSDYLASIALDNPLFAEPIDVGRRVLIECILQEIIDAQSIDSLTWQKRLTSGLKTNNARNWLVYLLHCSGSTLADIAKKIQPACSRERARQLENKIVKIVGIKPIELVEKAREWHEKQTQLLEKKILQEWIIQYDRLPILIDQKPEGQESSRLWDEICELNPKSRCDLLKKHGFAISSPEYDYHYQYVLDQTSPGSGYWREFENLKQFVLRHAVALGQPNLMPKQTSFPRSVGAIVQTYGGQSKVAQKIGLKYQGQLVGSDGGRRYWTDDRLNKLLIDTNLLLNQEPDLMPSHADILDFFSKTLDTEYQDKKPNSAVAALTKMGVLHWSEVASRFGKRYISGESQNRVTVAYIKAFVRDLGDHLTSLSPSELFVLFQAQGINRGEKEKFSRTFDALVDAVQSGVVDKDQLRSWADNNQVESIDELLELGSDLKAESSIEQKEEKLLERRSKQLMDEFPGHQVDSEIHRGDLPKLEPVRVLKALDKAAGIVDGSGTDSDKVEFLKAKATAKLWDACFSEEDSLIKKVTEFQTDHDSYSSEVREAFLAEYRGARSLPIPETYAFRDLKGNPRNPKLMQRLVAYRLKRDFRLLNLSGTGTGKTLSAIYAAQICGCKRLLISCPNGVIESWRRCLMSAFPSANLIIKPNGWEIPDVGKGVTVVIVNHERFQDRLAQQLLGFCINYQADMIVVDEIHQSKRRTSDTSSQRRKLMNEFIRISSNINPGLRVLGLSATPVINNLYEGRSLLELICQEPMEEIGETVDLNSCMNLYQQFVVHGIRMNPGQLARTKLIYQDIDATSLLPKIAWATKKGSYHDIEQLLVEPKLSSLGRSLEHGIKTVIFISYIKNTIKPITRWLDANNFSYSVYTGGEKEAQEEGFVDSLDEFIHGNSDILVASIKCVGTGVDGLQSVCNRAIFFQLPWTSTEFEQTVGRLDRDGTDFESVDVFLPMTDVSLPNGDRWSWCRSKLDRIESKRDIAKAAVDGEIPDAASLISPSEASKYWLKWLQKLETQK
ncbi:DNA-directed RNA polymerase subunit alpha C-terminal domain-containing protein [Synechococcus sp. UW86]|uniref:DNA-directed RNA polymerase subunit alpha C-terminal domain-containing protein n=1 Tax=Synechococcus sp. UW86 TaxID=368491 RepID=UPI000E0E9726|nr:DNA-directed RNA polymerase subunit alpha C-terminal domain-containing protein [Synechococcus sp. UW86]